MSRSAGIPVRQPLATVKAELSKFVDEAEHRGKTIVITRHGKPAAAIVPIAIGLAPKKRASMTVEEAQAFLADLSTLGDPSFPAVDDLIAGRR